MKYDDTTLASRRLGSRSVAAALALMLATTSHGAQTDIASTPIITTTAALVKPNVMLLMDASGSMGRTHMPDEVETLTGPTSIGYKSSRCNALYYNPAQTYLLPRRFDDTPFPTPTYAAAPYAGFGAFYAIPDTQVKNLNSEFVAYDNSTLEAPVPPAYLDTPQGGYYYVYSGPETLTLSSPPCTQDDTGASVATPGGGNWTKVSVNGLSATEQENFAIWYAFYRTRLSLIKSAASLAFAPLKDTKRVGFITVEPQDTPTSAGINPIRFLPVGDFNSGQKDLWFKKLFSQPAGGASPAREGLARVGRYYGGKEDHINRNMPATGVNDPVQYACQQNFTIMTTDGYWNGQTETPGQYGGPLNLNATLNPDGTRTVGQQDGVLDSPYTPRPIFDGTTTSTRTDTDKTNAYTDNVCSLTAGRFKSTEQIQKRTFVVQRDSVKYPRHTVQWKAASSQFEAQTTQTTKTVTQTPQTRKQYALQRHHFTEEHYQHVKWQEQITQVSSQYRLQTVQVEAQTQQIVKTQTQSSEQREQWSTSTSQYVVSTTQYLRGREQFTQGVEQTIKGQWRWIAHVGAETGAPVQDCTDGPGVVCEKRVVLTPRLVDPANCIPDDATGPSSGPFYVRTTCDPGLPMTVASRPVATCAPGVVNSGAPNYTRTTCNRTVIDPVVAINGTCVMGTSQTGGPDFFLDTCTLPAANNTSTPVASCTISTTSSGGPNYITTICSQPAGVTNQPTTPSPACSVGSVTDGSFVTTTCTKSMSGPSFFSDSCVATPGTSPSYVKVTCTPSAPTNVAVPSASCSAGSSGPPNYIVTSCTPVAGGLYPARTAVDPTTCVNGASTGAPDYFETTCSNPPGPTNLTDFTASCTPGTTSDTGPPWITRICTRPVNSTGFADPSLCIPDTGAGYPYLTTTCTPGPTVPPFPPTPVDPLTTCTTFGTTVGPYPEFIVTHCDRRGVSPPTPTAVCTPGIGPSPDFIVTTCGDVYTDTPVAFCVLGPLPPDGIDTVTCVNPPGANNATINISGTCTDTPGASPDFVTITCPAPITTTTIVDPRTCPAGTTVGAAPGVLVTTCSAETVLTPYAPVAACTDSPLGTVPRTTCRQNSTLESNSAPCTTNTDANFVTTTCTSVTTDDYPVTCSAVTQTGTGPDVTCGVPQTSTGVPVASCALGVTGGPVDFETTTACNTVSDTGLVDFAGACVAGSGTTPSFVQTQCGSRVLSTHVADSGCVNDNGASTGIVVTCTDEPGGTGHQYSVAVSTTVTTTPYSGSSPTGPGVPVTTVGPTTVDPMCYPLVQTFPPKPPVVAPCTAWPCSTSTASVDAGSVNSLADVAQYYYRTDLRPLMSDVPGVPKAGTGAEDDNAPHQHMTTFTIGVGVSGTLNYRPDYRSLATTTGDFADIRTGVKDWPLWPVSTLNYYTDFTKYNNPKSIDDFWHTAVNGRGRYFSASDPTSVVQGLGDALAKIDDVLASGTADSVSTLQPTTTNNFAYSTSYKSGVWQGDVEARRINVSDGTLGAPVWSAKDLLGPRELAACDSRQIYLIRGGDTLTNFTWNTKLCVSGVPTVTPDGLDGTEQLSFKLGAVSALTQWGFMNAAQKTAIQVDGVLVNFLRGQRANEGFQINDATKLLRKRGEGTVGEGILGDIVDSQPVYVGEAFASYQENNYTAFKTGTTSREPMLYVGANDGMLHAFYASQTAGNRGQEAWAVIPSAVLPNLYKLADENYKRDGHQFYVDGTPVVGDVWDSGASQWRTILVGGLNAGGKGYYALDVTVPGVLPVAKWEFKQDSASCPAAAINVSPTNLKGDCNLGLSFGKPVITKLANRWVVMFTSGYNNFNGVGGTDGQGFLYVVDALNGTLIHKIGTGVGDAGTPSGLAQINNFVDNVLIDNTTLRAYGGDVLGNIWRFDFTSATATLLGKAMDPTNTFVQPITTRPELAELDGKPFVLIGTGRLLGSTDVTDTRIQSVYGLRDPLVGSSPIYDPLRSSLRPMKITQAAPTTLGDLSTAARTISCIGSAGDCARPNGFVLDLAEPGERVNVEMKLVLGALVFASNVPEPVPCSLGGHSWFNQVDFRTGAPIPGAVTSAFLSDSINVGFNVLQLPLQTGQQNPTYTGLFRQSGATNVNRAITPPEPLPSGKRISWREIAQ